MTSNKKSFNFWKAYKMERRNFIKKCGVIGASCLGVSLVLSSCEGLHSISSTFENGEVKVNKSEFELIKNGKITYRKYIFLRMESGLYPIVIYRFSDTEYKALLLRCTHQFVELNVNGNIITCPAHGSEFSDRGVVLQGPAGQSLKEFSVKMDENTIYIQKT